MTGGIGFTGQGWLQLGELATAFGLSAVVGLEREVRQKAAGLRTYALVGVASALFVLVSKYGFTDVLRPGLVVVDPSRVAAQVVSGLGFIGGGVIFMRRDVVRGLTTAASVWLTAALGMACGAGLPVLAVATTLGYFAIMLGSPPLVRRLRRQRRSAAEIQISYADGRGLLRAILVACTELRFAIDQVRLDRPDAPVAAREEGQDRPGQEWADEAGGALDALEQPHHPGVVGLRMQVRGRRPVSHLIARLGSIEGVLEVGTLDEAELD